VTAPFDLQQPYLKRQLIAYIGNKRALQPLLHGVFARLAEPGRSFLDPFCGSGAVARLARAMGFRVLAADWEFYAYVLSFAHLCVSPSQLAGLFGPCGGEARILEELNGLPDPAPRVRYVSRHFAPATLEGADYRRERLFYTPANAARIDAVRNRIEELYPGFELDADRTKEKLLLLASLLYQAATHTNTSGVFKACHKGFGGHSRDALGRILAPVRLEPPVLIEGAPGCEVLREDARRFVRSRPAEICYLDPPYNQHQYGSNYHLLNTIALWDRPPVSEERGADGRLLHKAGIRGDWVQTRSPYCRRATALPALLELLEAVDCRWLVLSYNTEGIIPFEQLLDALSSQGRLELKGNDSVKYRGGRQSITRQVHNLEFVLVVDRHRKAGRADRGEVRRVALANRLRLLLRGSFHPDRVRRAFPGADEGMDVGLGGRSLRLPMPLLYRFSPEAPGLADQALRDASPEALRVFCERLGSCQCHDRGEELDMLREILAREVRPAAVLEQRALWLLRKFAHRKYREQFAAAVDSLQTLLARSPGGYPRLAQGLPAVEALARARFSG
jgi:adenine-specific DNA-methyltransferase